MVFLCVAVWEIPYMAKLRWFIREPTSKSTSGDLPADNQPLAIWGVEMLNSGAFTFLANTNKLFRLTDVYK